MEPAYRLGERLLVNRLAYRGRTPQPGEVVVLRDPEVPRRRLLKRVIAVHSGAPGQGLMVEVLGDNPAGRDSRDFGPVPARLIVGRVWRRY